MKRFLWTIFLILCAVVSMSAQQTTIRILHYTETTGYDHNTRNYSLQAFQGFAAALSTQDTIWEVISDDTGQEFVWPGILQYHTVVFSNTSGNSGLTPAQRSAMEQYIESGGRYIGIHAASDTYRHSSANGGSKGTWDYYPENIAGCSVQQSPNHTSSSHNNNITTVSSDYQYTHLIPSPWNKTEEYYYWENGYLNTQDYTTILQVGQTGGSSYDAPRMVAHYRADSSGGCLFYTSLGHDRKNFQGIKVGTSSTPDLTFLQLIFNALTSECQPGTFPILSYPQVHLRRDRGVLYDRINWDPELQLLTLVNFREEAHIYRQVDVYTVGGSHLSSYPIVWEDHGDNLGATVQMNVPPGLTLFKIGGSNLYLKVHVQ